MKQTCLDVYTSNTEFVLYFVIEKRQQKYLCFLLEFNKSEL